MGSERNSVLESGSLESCTLALPLSGCVTVATVAPFKVQFSFLQSGDLFRVALKLP